MDETYSFTRYLTAKKSVDDRALNRHVWDKFAAALIARQGADKPRPRVLEVGAGTGTMIERILEQGLMINCDYVAIDADAANIEAAQTSLPLRAKQYGYRPVQPENSMTISRQQEVGSFYVARDTDEKHGSDRVQVITEPVDMYNFVSRPEQKRRYDILIAHAFLDLLDVPHALAKLSGLLNDDALLYLTINFDGATILQPEIDSEFDALIERLYHETMDRRVVAGKPSGDSHTGRHLFGHLRTADIDILAAGSSDWVVHASQNGYVDDEAYFLHFIIETMKGALADDPRLDEDRFAAWIRQRHQQIDQNELVYIAHQLDFLAQKQKPV